ncbi:hypothetical protein ACQP2Y_00585 [Actinoplanes sp. CA-051413]|uniref:hypothetical protein n=1 Tax=Actinoplanes sp. CA-051413 TaxID=3239899 RepID=UPI003D99A3EE
MVEIICLGEGTIRTTVRAASHDPDPQSMRTPPPDASVVNVRCGDKPAPVRVDVRAPKLVYVQHQADPAAVGSALVAHIVRLP